MLGFVQNCLSRFVRIKEAELSMLQANRFPHSCLVGTVADMFFVPEEQGTYPHQNIVFKEEKV